MPPTKVTSPAYRDGMPPSWNVQNSGMANEGTVGNAGSTTIPYANIPGSILSNGVGLGAAADPTGAKDSTSAIQNVINAASGGVVDIPPGTYLVSSLTVPSRVWLKGSGIGVSIFSGNAASKVIDVTGNRVKLTDFTVNGNSLADYGVYLEDQTYQFLFDRVEVTYCTGSPGIGFANGAGSGRCYSGRLRNCFAVRNNIGGSFIKSCQDLTLEDCNFYYNLTNQLTIGDGTTQAVSNVRIRGGDYEGISPDNSTQNVIYLNRVHGCVLDGVYVQGPTAGSTDVMIDNTGSADVNTVTITGLRTDSGDSCTAAVTLNTKTYLTCTDASIDSGSVTTTISNLTTTSVVNEINSKNYLGNSYTSTAIAGDPYGVNANMNYLPLLGGLELTEAIVTSYTVYLSLLVTYSYAMSNLCYFCVASSGNINVGVYAPDVNGLPGKLAAFAGATNVGVACPSGAAMATEALNTTIIPGRGYWFALLADNTTASFRGFGGAVTPGATKALRIYSTTNSLVLPSDLTGLTASGAGTRYPLMSSVA